MRLKSLQIIDAIKYTKEPMTIYQIAAQSGLNYRDAYKEVANLVKEGIIVKHDDKYLLQPIFNTIFESKELSDLINLILDKSYDVGINEFALVSNLVTYVVAIYLYNVFKALGNYEEF